MIGIGALQCGFGACKSGPTVCVGSSEAARSKWSGCPGFDRRVDRASAFCVVPPTITPCTAQATPVTASGVSVDTMCCTLACPRDGRRVVTKCCDAVCGAAHTHAPSSAGTTQCAGLCRSTMSHRATPPSVAAKTPRKAKPPAELRWCMATRGFRWTALGGISVRTGCSVSLVSNSRTSEVARPT